MTSRLGKQLAEMVSALNSAGIRFALIGGLALAAYKIIRALLRANRATLNMDEVRDYFRLFEREALLDEILNEIA